MDNQHKKITGYRDLSQAEIDLMNEIKANANKVGALIALIERALEKECETLLIAKADISPLIASGYEAGRWTSIAKTHLQQGFMALTRAVARPESF